jgi:hypothetical protein
MRRAIAIVALFVAGCVSATSTVPPTATGPQLTAEPTPTLEATMSALVSTWCVAHPREVAKRVLDARPSNVSPGPTAGTDPVLRVAKFPALDREVYDASVELMNGWRADNATAWEAACLAAFAAGELFAIPAPTPTPAPTDDAAALGKARLCIYRASHSLDTLERAEEDCASEISAVLSFAADPTLVCLEFWQQRYYFIGYSSSEASSLAAAECR